MKFRCCVIMMNSLFFCFQRARALAASGPVFTAFTPQSILRSSLRPTPVATPSASPGRSITPPLRSKESRITFIEEESSELEKSIRWTNGVRTRISCQCCLDGGEKKSQTLITVNNFASLWRIFKRG